MSKIHLENKMNSTTRHRFKEVYENLDPIAMPNVLIPDQIFPKSKTTRPKRVWLLPKRDENIFYSYSCWKMSIFFTTLKKNWKMFCSLFAKMQNFFFKLHNFRNVSWFSFDFNKNCNELSTINRFCYTIQFRMKHFFFINTLNKTGEFQLGLSLELLRVLSKRGWSKGFF